MSQLWFYEIVVAFILFWWWFGLKISEISQYVVCQNSKCPNGFFFFFEKGFEWKEKEKKKVEKTDFIFFFTFKTYIKTCFGKLFSKAVFTNFENLFWQYFTKHALILARKNEKWRLYYEENALLCPKKYQKSKIHSHGWRLMKYILCRVTKHKEESHHYKMKSC